MNIWGKILALIAVAMALTLGVATYFIVTSSSTVADLESVKSTELELFKDAWEITWLDEVLTAAAARSIQSGGDPVWQQRYDAHVALLDEALAGAKQQSTPEEFAIFERVSVANDKLVAYETQIFALVAAGNTQEAYAILAGDYVTQKQMYSAGVAEFNQRQDARLQATVQHQIDRAQRGRNIGITLSVLALGAMLGGGLLFARSVTTRVNRLAAISDHLSRGEIEGLRVDVAGHDEIGRLGQSLQGVLAAFHELHDEVLARDTHAA
jgi:methyl-accepting chemotaxis protein